MKKLYFFIVLLVPHLFLKAQYSDSFIKPQDIYKGLTYMGLDIYKYAVASDITYDFNLLFEEYKDGKCIDSAKLISDESINLAKNVFQKPLVISNDTSFLCFYVQQKDDSVYTFNYAYPTFSSYKRIIIQNSRLNKHGLKEFASPKISNKGKYPVLVLSTPWKQDLGGQTVYRYCFPENIEQIKKLVEHFYVFSILAY
jgi:hypothetical protein